MLKPDRLWIRPGWQSLAEAALDRLSDAGVAEVVEVREKLGRMRIAVRPQPQIADEITQILAEVGDRSLTVCDLCGNAGRLREGPWRRTRCDEHRDEQPD